MRGSPQISIVIAAFRAVENLPRAIDSVLSQADVISELIVIDGASEDGTVELLESYGEQIAAWLSEPDHGIYDAWNKGIALAQGQWIAFLGADDVFLPDALARYQSFVVSHSELDYVSSRLCLIHRNGASRIIGQAWSWRIFRHYMNVAHVGSLHHRRLFERHGGFDATWKICGDYEFLLRFGAQLRAGFVDEVLVEMAAGGISESSTRGISETLRIKLRLASVGVIQAWLDFLEAWCKWHLRRLSQMLPGRCCCPRLRLNQRLGLF